MGSRRIGDFQLYPVRVKKEGGVVACRVLRTVYRWILDYRIGELEENFLVEGVYVVATGHGKRQMVQPC